MERRGRPEAEAAAGPPGTAVVLLSGGLDSTTCLAIARAAGHRCVALSFRYGQRHEVELDRAAAVATAAGVEHVVVPIDLRAFGGSALTDDIAVPVHDSVDELDDGIPATYVPARNTIFLALALALAEVRGASHIYLGVNALDYSGYPDCRPEFVDAFQALADVATRSAVEREPGAGGAVRIEAPLLHLTKAEIIRWGVELGVDHGLTISCYDPTPEGRSCGRCDACLLRRKGFADAGVSDPIAYVDAPAGDAAP